MIKFENVASFESLFEAGMQCLDGVEWKESIQKFAVSLPLKAAKAHDELMNGKYMPEKLTEFDILERGKKRHIRAVKPYDRMIQKSLTNNALKPIIEPLLIDDNGASRLGMGTEYALKRLRLHLVNHYKKYGNTGGILIMDLHDFFGSIDHKKLLDMYDEVIEDKRILDLVSKFIYQFDEGTGLGLGSEVSQISAIFYPNKIDHYIKDTLGVDRYARYMDDSYIISDNLDFLRKCRDDIRDMYAELGIKMNIKKTKIIKFQSGSFVYLQKRVSFGQNGKIIMKPLKKIFTNRRRKLRKQYKKYIAGQTPLKSIQSSYSSWRGNILKYDCYKQVHNMDKYFMQLFSVSYDGATIDDIRFQKTLNMYRDKFNKHEPIDISKLNNVFGKWSNDAKYDNNRQIIYRKLKHKYYRFLYQIKNK